MMRCLSLLLLLMSGVVSADERILSFHSDIRIGAEGGLTVTETIRVRAEGNEIRRGIYRDIPTEYKDRFGNDVSIRYEPLTVLRNDRAEDFHTERNGRFLRTYFGSAARMLDRGVHTYSFRYRVERSLGFFDDHDELYRNVTGNEWAFPIDRASATVTFDFDVPRDRLALIAYTGRLGASGRDYRSALDAAGNPAFESTREFGPREGMTIAVSWPKGLVAEPTGVQEAKWLLNDNLNLLIAVAGLLGMLLWYVPAWRAFGRDPDPGVVMTRYEPPAGYSPASIRYVDNMHYDSATLTAAVVSLAVKGYLRIDAKGDDHSLLRLDPGPNPPDLATGERELHDALFEAGDIVILDNEYHERIGGAQNAHRQSLKRDYNNRYFKTNGLLSLPALAVGAVAAFIALRTGSGPTVAVIATIMVMVFTLITFAIIMRRPTAVGRKLLDEVSGFREYLEIAEKDEMNLRNPPDRTPDLFERYLPFALAMGVEQQWAERFTRVFAGIRGPDRTAYSPAWYSGSWNSLDVGNSMAKVSTGLGGAMAASVSAPGSSSGAGGGGFSGGGGGGGGGGGW